MIKKMYLLMFIAIGALNACRRNIKSEMLYGDWKYVKLGNPNSDDPGDTVLTTDLNIYKPHITFSTKNELTMYWGGKVLSHGTYKVDGEDIVYTEQLPDGKPHTFPFKVSKLDTKIIVFETSGKEGSRVTAIKH